MVLQLGGERAGCLPYFWGHSGVPYSNPRDLILGDVYGLRRDGWSTPPDGAFYESDVLPQSYTIGGLDKDNPGFQRRNLARDNLLVLRLGAFPI